MVGAINRMNKRVPSARLFSADPRKKHIPRPGPFAREMCVLVSFALVVPLLPWIAGVDASDPNFPMRKS